MPTTLKSSRRNLLAAAAFVCVALSGCSLTSASAQLPPPDAPKQRERSSSPEVNGKRLPPARVGLSEERNRNERNEPIELDETASLACANAQFAWVATLQNDRFRATEEVAVAAARAEASAVVAIREGGAALGRDGKGSDVRSPVETFLRICVRNGYIL